VVACATNGDLFCRECAINDLLAQRKEIKRLEKEREEAKKRLVEDDARTLEEAKVKELQEFELVSMGLEATKNLQNGKKRKAPTIDDGHGHESAKVDAATEAFRQREIEVNGKRRKVFELGEAEMGRYAQSERERLKKEIEREKVYMNNHGSLFLKSVHTYHKRIHARPTPNPLWPRFGSLR
jgi:nitric oxide synthase-interacting protein